MHCLDQLRAGELAGARRLSLSCGLTDFPREIFDLRDTLEVLDLSGNALTALPDDLARLHRLRIVFCSDNDFTALPEVLGACPELTMVGFKANRIREVMAASLPAQLRWLILTDNAIDALPEAIGRCTALQKLMLAGNRLSALPASLVQCTRLELLRIAANRIDVLQPWLMMMPRLSWLACAGNPCGMEEELQALQTAALPETPWRALAVEELLGEGASGVIHRAQRDGDAAVAVKLFKGAVTSDGLPSSEMAAAMCAGAHPSLIGALGRVVDHPLGASGLVMPLVGPEFERLAGPPSLDSCTRDIYLPDARFDLAVLLRIARDIASAAGHLHARGIMHGDLYGHNILRDRNGHAWLGDFGAASFYRRGDEVAERMQRLEVRAFGCLLEELIARCAAPDQHTGTLVSLTVLIAECLAEDVDARPSFAAIAAQLDDHAGRCM